MKNFKHTAALLLAAAILAPAGAVAEPAAKAQRGPVFPMHLVSSTVDRGAVTLRYYSLKQWQPFCLVYAGVDMKFGDRWDRPQKCLSADSNGLATVTIRAEGRGPLIVSVVLPSGEVRSDVIDVAKFRSEN